MTTVQEFNDETVRRLQLWLENAAEQDNKKYIEVYIDGMKLIYKTDKIEKLEELNSWVEDKTNTIKVLAYSSQGSHRYETHEFRTPQYLQRLEAEKQKKETQQNQPLHGIEEVEKRVNERLEAERKELAFETMKQQKEAAEKENELALELLEKQRAKILELEAKLNSPMQGLVTSGINVLSKQAETNPKIASMLGGLLEKAGEFFGGDAPTPKPENEEPLGEVNIKKKPNKNQTTGGLDGTAQNNPLNEEEKFILAIFKVAKQNMSKEMYGDLLKLNDAMAKKPEYLKAVVDFLREEEEDDAEATPENKTETETEKKPPALSDEELGIEPGFKNTM
jgi:hypothetical protein